jgi:hypothetical protein
MCFLSPTGSWVDKPKYFLAQMEDTAYCVSEPNEPEFMAWPPDSEATLYRMRARFPKEMLHRKVVNEAGSLTVCNLSAHFLYRFTFLAATPIALAFSSIDSSLLLVPLTVADSPLPVRGS